MGGDNRKASATLRGQIMKTSLWRQDDARNARDDDGRKQQRPQCGAACAKNATRRPRSR